MSTKLPYVVHPNSVARILEKAREAKTPERFTVDFLEAKLGFRGGNYRQFIPLAKKLGFLNTDGTPTDLYRSFRNPSTSKASIAEGLRKAYRELFERNEYAGSLDKDQLKGLVLQVTGLNAKDALVSLICKTFNTLKALADFDAKLAPEEPPIEPNPSPDKAPSSDENNLDLRLSYTINLVLPKTDDAAVFNAIFRALREHLLRR